MGKDPGGGDAVQRGHPDVHQDHIGSVMLGEPHPLVAVGRLCDHLNVGLAIQNEPEAGPDESLIVDDEDSNGHSGGPSMRGAAVQPVQLTQSTVQARASAVRHCWLEGAELGPATTRVGRVSVARW